MYSYNQTFPDSDNMSSQRKTCEILKTYLNYFMSKFLYMFRHLNKLKFTLTRKGLKEIWLISEEHALYGDNYKISAYSESRNFYIQMREGDINI